MFWGQNLIQLFLKGGFAMWPLLLCSVIGAAIVIERGLFFWNMRLNYSAFIQKLKQDLKRGREPEVLETCEKSSSPIARLAAVYLAYRNQDALRNDVLRREGSLALETVEARLRELATVTHIAPLLGLLGTVTGLVSAFHQIELMGGQVQPGDLAAGIWEALITTVYGLVIAIPCMAAYHGFEKSADKIARRMQFLVSELDEFFGKHSSSYFQADNVEETENKMKTMG
jgi:biopolymer transport protein ExbB